VLAELSGAPGGAAETTAVLAEADSDRAPDLGGGGLL
jgi:hypothetical protein